ncbi:MAG: ribosome-associated translation inhibitor RaiA [Simkaniaceae bacterium]|nr:ribosome-associated translation inhibitor RaiA [Candidatus Sacchlamyda saccharinae]
MMVDKDKFAEEDALGYNIYIIGKNFQLTDPMRQHVTDKLAKIERFHNHIMDVHVTLEIQKVEHVCIITCHFNHIKVKVEARSTDMYASIDRAIQKLQRLFSKWKGKIQDYHKRPVSMVDMSVNVHRRPPMDPTDEANEEIDAENLKNWIPHKVIATESQVLKALSIEEAIMKMELSSDPFMLFRDDEDKKLKLIYRREDEHYGVIQAEG